MICWKSRTDIEQSYDTFKDTIHADGTYMRDDLHLKRWMFINLIALMMHYRFHGMLRKMDLLSRYSPEDVIRHLDRIHMLRIGDQWKLSEIPENTTPLERDLNLRPADYESQQVHCFYRHKHIPKNHYFPDMLLQSTNLDGSQK